MNSEVIFNEEDIENALDWYLSRELKKEGPYTLEDIKKAWLSGVEWSKEMVDYYNG